MRLELSEGSCSSSVNIGEIDGLQVCSVIYVVDNNQDDGNHQQRLEKVFQKVELVAKNKKCAEIWFPDVASHWFSEFLSKNGYFESILGRRKTVSPKGEVISVDEVSGYRRVLA